jgi:hypothetical protein
MNVEGLEFKTVSLILDCLLDKIGKLNEEVAMMQSMRIPANHPIAYQARADMRFTLVTVREFQELYVELHDDTCGCGKTQAEVLGGSREAMATCDQFINDVDEMERDMSPMGPEEGVSSVVHALARHFSGPGTVFGDEGPDFTVVDLGGYL